MSSMMTRTSTRSGWIAIAVALVIGAGAATAGAAPRAEAGHDKVPITTASSEARALYLQARDLLEKLRATDAHKRFEAAVAKDQNFALGYLGLANTAPSRASSSRPWIARWRSPTRRPSRSAS